ncbi:aminoacyl tRNA synthase complex-interacting multifunctional protein 1 [Hermetia illucens]|nr:aminoacyl tRNA synthase complex-interacting multifunctional protein 1 [Hermetia illucens]
MIGVGRHLGLCSYLVNRSILKMSNIERVLANNNLAEQLLDSLKSELTAIKRELIIRKKKELIQQNNLLSKQVELAKSELIQLECRNGKEQIPVPGETAPVQSQSATKSENKQKQDQPQAKAGDAKPPKAEKEKKPKKEKPAATAGDTKKGGAAPAPEAPIDVGRLDLRVGKIVEVSKHPDADSLYLEKIDCGEANPRTVVSGLVKFVPIEEMRDRMVVVLCNLKPAKMRGVTSEAMVMCASTPEKVEVLSPPAGSVPGDLVHCEGYTRCPDAQLNPKKKIFETCAPDLKTNGELVACYKDSPLSVPGKGNVVAQSLKNVQVK